MKKDENAKKNLVPCLRAVLPHLSIVLSFYFVVMLILNDYNPTMNIFARPINVGMLIAYVAVNLLQGGLHFWAKHKAEKQG